MTENYDADFIDLTPIDVEIEGRKFKLKPLNGAEADEITSKFTKFVENPDDPDNFKTEFNIALRNSLWLQTCVIDAPYQINDGSKPWIEHEPKIRLEILNKLKPKIRNGLLKKIRIMNAAESDVTKNSKKQS